MTTGPAWAELHCHSSYSFLDGASSPAELAAEAARLELAAVAITDHDGMYGVPQFAQAAARFPGLRTVFGAELTLGAGKRGEPDPAGRHLLVLARGPAGYRRLCSVISAAQLAGGQKGQPVIFAGIAGRGARRAVGSAHRMPEGACARSARGRRRGGGAKGAALADRDVRAAERLRGAGLPERPVRRRAERRAV